MGQRILLVDDQVENCRLMEAVLEAAGYDVTWATDGAAFLESFDRLRPDICICDVQMPKMSGIEVLKKVKERSPGTPVLMFTGSESVEDAVGAMKAGAFDWLSKPLDREKMLVTLRNAATLSSQAGEISRLRRQLKEAWTFESIVGNSPALQQTKTQARKLASSEATVLVRGENGTGKELFAKAMHFAGPRAGGPFVDINCAALTESLLESELFGHEKGAFTGALNRHVGKFEAANGGTIFLDEVGDMPLATQAKLLRVLQERSFQRVGGTERVTVDVRVVSATNQDLEARVAQGAFRQDFLYRINLATIEVPPLRSRIEDLAELAAHFASLAARKERKNAPSISAAALQALKSHGWPGNIRELENVVARAVILCDGLEILPEDLPASVGAARGKAAAGPVAPAGGSLEEAVEALERQMIVKALEQCAWVKAKAARELRVTERILGYKMDVYGIKRG